MLQRTIETSTVEVIEGVFVVLRLAPDARVSVRTFVVAHDSTETTVIVSRIDARGEQALDSQEGFRILRINVSAPFMAPGFLATVCKAIAERGANVFVVSTFSRDYVLVREEDLEVALAALRAAGFPILSQATVAL